MTGAEIRREAEVLFAKPATGFGIGIDDSDRRFAVELAVLRLLPTVDMPAKQSSLELGITEGTGVWNSEPGPYCFSVYPGLYSQIISRDSKQVVQGKFTRTRVKKRVCKSERM